MDDALTDLDDRPGQVPGPDDPVGVALRRALDADPRPGGTALLAGVQARATRSHRRRLGVAGAAVAASVAAVALVVPAVASATRSAASPAGRTTPAAVAPDDRLRTGEDDGAPSADAVSPLLPPTEVTAFSGVELALRSTSGRRVVQPAVGGACTAAALPVPPPSSSWQAEWSRVAGSPSVAGAPRTGLVETVWQWDDPAPAGAALDAIRAQVPGCSGPGAEGLGPLVEQDAGHLWPAGGRVLALTRQAGGSTQEVQVVVVTGTSLVRLHATGLTVDGGVAAVDAMARTARVAVKKAMQASQESQATLGAAAAQASAEASAEAASRAAVPAPTPQLLRHGPDPRG